MSTPGPDDPTAPSQPPAELGGLDPKELLQIGLETIMTPAGLGPDLEATVRIAAPQASSPGQSQPELPLPEELTNLLPHGNYSVESFLGQGGMGAVYKGMQVRLKRPVAIKIMRRDANRDHDFEARFEREAQAMAKLNHPNIVSVIDYGEASQDYLYIVMELIDGADLMDVIRGGQMTQAMALTLLPQICDALQFAHEHGIVHRDIKPSNIMVTRDGRVKMADFGLAKHFDTENSFRTQTGTGMGTPDYAAPEQFDPKAHIDHRADIYALGVMIYQMITGQLPRGVWKPPSERSECDPHWDDIVSRAMQSDPADRYQQASQIKTDVSGISLVQKGSADTPVRPPSQGGDAAKMKAAGKSARAPVKSRAPLVFGVAVGAVVLALGAFFAFKPKPSGPQTSGSGTSVPSAPDSAQGTVRITSSAAAWKPLFTDEEWKAPSKPGLEFKDGLLHVQGGGGAFKPQPSVDGAIRAKAVLRDGMKDATITLRGADSSGGYRLTLGASWKTVDVRYGKSPNPAANPKLGIKTLSKPLKVGDSVLLELRAEGKHLTALVNGEVVIEADDDALQTSGQWGVTSQDGWFESVEVQTLAPTIATVSPSPSLPVSASSSSATKDAPFVNTLGMKFVPVPITGGPTGGQRVLFSVWETRVQDYEVFAKETKSAWSKAKFPQEATHPAVNVMWEEAQAFCTWLTERERKAGRLGASERYRLPSDHEWSCAAGIGEREDAAQTPAEKSLKIQDAFTWGSAWPPSAGAGNYGGEEILADSEAGQAGFKGQKPIVGYRDGYVYSAPVGSFTADRWGLFDLGGNAMEWCEDWFDEKKEGRGVRGTSWGSADRRLMFDSRRTKGDSGKRNGFYGFRVVLAPPSSERPAAGATVTPPPSLPVSSSSPPNPIHTFAGHRYQFVPGNLSWTKAKADAEALGGHLATLTSKEEDDFVRATFGDRIAQMEAGFWLGASEETPGGGWRWVTGEKFDFTAWGKGGFPSVRPDMDKTKPTALLFQRHEHSPKGAWTNCHYTSPKHALIQGFLVEWDDAGGATATTTVAPARQTLNLLALIDPVKDRGAASALSGRNEWVREGAALVYKSDGKGGKIAAPVALTSRDYEMELLAERTSGRDKIHLDLPRPGGQLPLVFNAPGQKFIFGQQGNPWTGTGPVVHVVVRVKMSADGKSDHIVITRKDTGEQLTDWRGSMASLGFSGESHPAFPGQPFTSIFVLKDSYVIKTWTLRVFEGEAKVLRTPAGAASDTVSRSPALPVSASPSSATKDTPFINTLGMKFVPVPITGGPTDKQRVLFSIWETRVQDYEHFVRAIPREWPKPDFEQTRIDPAVNVSWDDATAFCAWLTERERKAGELGVNERYRLPSDHEWSCAVGIGDKEDPAMPAGKKNGTLGGAYPWGTSYPPGAPSGNYADEDYRREFEPKANGKKLNWVEGYKDGFPFMAPLGRFAPNSLGLYDLGGNVWEWCQDKYEEAKDERVLRGGSWRTFGSGGLLSSSRFPLASKGYGDGHGFRVVLAPANPTP